MADHKLHGGSLKRTDAGITARCICGWSSSHFTSMSASAAFMDHQEREEARNRESAEQQRPHPAR